MSLHRPVCRLLALFHDPEPIELLLIVLMLPKSCDGGSACRDHPCDRHQGYGRAGGQDPHIVRKGEYDVSPSLNSLIRTVPTP